MWITRKKLMQYPSPQWKYLTRRIEMPFLRGIDEKCRHTTLWA
jgi:hypothetical protein